MNNRLLILACSATKRPDAGWMPAIDRYNGPLWQTLRAVDANGRLAMSAYLSARYGFGPSRGPMDNYDARLTPDLAKQMIAGGLETRWPRPPTRKMPDSYGMHAGCQIASMTELDPFEMSRSSAASSIWKLCARSSICFEPRVTSQKTRGSSRSTRRSASCVNA